MDLIEAQRKLNEKDLAIFNAEMQRQAKSVGLAYGPWFLFGWFGVHNFTWERFFGAWLTSFLVDME